MERRVVVVHADLAQHQSDTPTDGCRHAKSTPLRGRLSDTRRCSPRPRTEMAMPERVTSIATMLTADICCPSAIHAVSRRQRCERHEQLSVARADDDIALEETEVAYDIAYESGEQHPPVSLDRAARGPRRPHDHPEHHHREEQGEGHAQHVKRQVAQTLAAQLAQQRRGRPGEGHADGNKFADIHQMRFMPRALHSRRMSSGQIEAWISPI